MNPLLLLTFTLNLVSAATLLVGGGICPNKEDTCTTSDNQKFTKGAPNAPLCWYKFDENDTFSCRYSSDGICMEGMGENKSIMKNKIC
ncbi:hypothetical protein K502DRAFT_348530 [Neoconidiobolus thromboides FSU 785]|nr:hypothetical protein K502DRAFT_348530 [Neoconidiobolus thromboides FSU 785]